MNYFDTKTNILAAKKSASQIDLWKCISVVFGAILFPFNVTAFWLDRISVIFLPNGLNHRLGRLECNAITAKVVGSGRCVPTANLLYFSIFFFRRFLLNSCCYRSIHRHALHQNLFPLSKNSQTVRSSFLSLDILFSFVLFRIVVNSNVRNNSR